MKKRLLTSTAVVILAAGSVHADTIIGFEAESGTLGSEYTTFTQVEPDKTDDPALGGSYIEHASDAFTLGVDQPNTDGFTVSYDLNLTAGTYDVYVKLRYPSNGEDSFFIAKNFGDTDPTVTADWLKIERFVGGLPDSQPAFEWSDALPLTLTAPGGPVTWEIGAREAGNDIDAFAFVTTGQSVTDTELDNAVTGPETSSLALTDFTYNASTGDSEVSIKGSANTAYKVVEADDLDFTTSDPVTLTGATVGNLSSNEVTTDASGNATVQFNLGTDKAATFIRAENAPPPPPLLSEDFDEENGSFTVTKVAGTDWAWGDPDSTGPGGAVTAGNGGAGQCWGTDIGNQGFYADPTTDTRLQSPRIDLTSVAAAELGFAQAIDFPAGDSAMVRLINDDTDAEIVSGAFPLTITDANTSTADWETVGPISLPVGAPVRIEWCFTGTGDTTDDFMGWYIDDVQVVEASP